MKQYIKNIIMMTALLLASAGAWADGNVIKVIHINQQLTVKLRQKEQIVHIVQGLKF